MYWSLCSLNKEVINRNSYMIVGVLYHPLGTDINAFAEEFSKIVNCVQILEPNGKYAISLGIITLTY